MVYESTVGSSDLELGQEYFGSIVTKVKQDVTTEVEDGVEWYVVKRSVALRNGMKMTEEYKREKSLGEIKSKRESLSKDSLPQEKPRDDSDARARARAMMADKKKRRPKKSKSLSDSPRKNKPRKSKSVPKSERDLGGIEPWFNFDQPETKIQTVPESTPMIVSDSEHDAMFFESDFDPFPAKVLPESRAPSIQNDDAPVIGVWKHQDGTDDSDWRSVDVIVTKNLPADMEPGKPNGIVAIADGLNPKEVGKLRPDQLKFLPPGKALPPFFKKVGHWTPSKLNIGWPPKKSSKKKRRSSVGKLKLEEVWPNKIPETAIIYPQNDAPDRQDDDKEIIIAKGIWKFPENKPQPEGADAWAPTYVQLNLDGGVDVCEGETEREDDDEEKPEGVWGMSPADDANAANPSDLWFYPPDEEFDDGFQPIGKWKMIKQSFWPPRSIGKVEDKRQFKQYQGSLNNVGKLKMPAFFAGK